jgi:hypothetical protein
VVTKRLEEPCGGRYGGTALRIIEEALIARVV